MVDIGGSHVKCLASGQPSPRSFASGPQLTARQAVKRILRITRDWQFDAVSVGFPGVVCGGRIIREPHNLGRGWVGFDWPAALGCPVQVINDAAMQALGGYDGGRALFLGLGTGLGSALIVDDTIVALELARLPCAPGQDYEDYLCNRTRQRLGNRRWRRRVTAVVEALRGALIPDYVLLGGGNAKHLKRLPAHTRRGDNGWAFWGGFRLWDR